MKRPWPDRRVALLPSLAPFWTDLEGLAGADPNLGIYAATLRDSATGEQWIVIESRLNVFGTDDTRVFQVWIGINDTEDITYAYDPANLPAAPGKQAFLVGAENQLGQGDMVAELPTEDLRVVSTDAVPGDRATYTITVRGEMRGDHIVRTEMAASGIAGITVVRDRVGVTTGRGGPLGRRHTASRCVRDPPVDGEVLPTLGRLSGWPSSTGSPKPRSTSTTTWRWTTPSRSGRRTRTSTRAPCEGP